MMQFYQKNPGTSTSCQLGEPINAEPYLRNVFAPRDLGNPQIIKVENNPLVVRQMEETQSKYKAELTHYTNNVQIYNTAINATVRWADSSEGQVVLGISIIETALPNQYTGAITKSYVTAVSKKTVFRYPASEKAQALFQLGVIMGSIHTNPAWTNMVNNFWKDVRLKRQVEHIGRLKIMDEQTRSMAAAGAERARQNNAYGDAIIAQGNDRLKNMDMDLRSWEQRQASQDKMHTSFVKTIREVENYQDASGKVELASGYNHAWSRGDGNTFVMSNNPNFDPSSVFQDQNWKQMKRVD
jgi:hypothetical protein